MPIDTLLSPAGEPADTLSQTARQALAPLAAWIRHPADTGSERPQAILRDMVRQWDQLLFMERARLVAELGAVDADLGLLAAYIAARLDQAPELRPAVLTLLDLWTTHQAERPADCLMALRATDDRLQGLMFEMIYWESRQRPCGAAALDLSEEVA